MNIAIGGWLLLAVAGAPREPLTVDQIVSTGVVVHGFENADECETERAKFRGTQNTFCLPALAFINR